MRRPLCLICMAFVVTVMLILMIDSPPSFHLQGKDGNIIRLEGTVYRKEHKKDVLYVYINQINMRDSNSQSNLKNQIEATNPNNQIEQDNPQENQQNKQQEKQQNKQENNQGNQPCDYKLRTNELEQKNDTIIPKGVLCLMQGEEPKIGSRVQVQGKAVMFKAATNPGEFDQLFYWRVRHIDMQMKDCKIISHSMYYNQWKEALYRLERSWEERYEQVFPEAYASVMKAMLLGNRREIDKEIKEQYQRNGISHILAISGVKTPNLDPSYPLKVA